MQFIIRINKRAQYMFAMSPLCCPEMVCTRSKCIEGSIENFGIKGRNAHFVKKGWFLFAHH